MPGYVSRLSALKIGRPVEWIETRTGNLTSTGFARDYLHGHRDWRHDGGTALHVATTANGNGVVVCVLFVQLRVSREYRFS